MDQLLGFFKDEASRRVIKVTNTIDEKTVLELSRSLQSLSPDEQTAVTEDTDIANYFILAYMAEQQDRKEVETAAKITRKPGRSKAVFAFGATAALALLVACSPAKPAETATPDYRATLTAFPTLTPEIPSPTNAPPMATPSPEVTVPPENIVVPTDDNLKKVEDSLPPGETVTMRSGEVFSEEDIEMIRKSVVSFTIENPQGEGHYICTGQILTYDRFLAIIATTRHCFASYADVNRFDLEEGYRININERSAISTTFSKPELNQHTQGSIREVYYPTALSGDDFALVEVYFDALDGTLVFEPFGLENLKPDTSIEPGDIRLNVSYPGFFIDDKGNALLAVNEGAVVETGIVTEFDQTNIPGHPYRNVASYEAITGAGSSGSFVYDQDPETDRPVAVGFHIGAFNEVQDPSGRLLYTQKGLYTPFSQETLDWIDQTVKQIQAKPRY